MKLGIVQSCMKRSFQGRLNFGSIFDLHVQQNRHHWTAPFVVIKMVQIPALYLLPSPSCLHVHVQCSIVLCVSYSVYPLSKEWHDVSMRLNGI